MLTAPAASPHPTSHYMEDTSSRCTTSSSSSAAVMDAATALVLALSALPGRELHAVAPLVCHAWRHAAAAAACMRPLVADSQVVCSAERIAALAAWLRAHGAGLTAMRLLGFKYGVDAAWWRAIFSAHLSALHELALRSCGSPGLPLGLLSGSAPRLLALVLQHTPAPPSAVELACLTQLRSLRMTRCGLGRDHLAAIGELHQLQELQLIGDDLAVDALQLPPLAAVAPPEGSSDGQAGSSTSTLDRRADPGDWLVELVELRSLDLSGCRLHDGALGRLTALQALTRLCLRCTQLDAVCCGGARYAAGSGPSPAGALRRVADNTAGGLLAVGTGAAAACAVVGSLPQLLELDVSYVPNAPVQLCAGVAASGGRGLCALAWLDVSHTGANDTVLTRLVAATPRLRWLGVAGNPSQLANLDGSEALMAAVQQLTGECLP